MDARTTVDSAVGSLFSGARLRAEPLTSCPDDVDTLARFCEKRLGDKQFWPTPPGYPDSLALCVVDSIYSTGAHYTSVINVVNRYRRAHGHRDGAKALLRSITEAGGARRWAHSVAGNMKPAHTRPGAPLKAEVIEKAAELLMSLDIDTVEDLVAAVADSPRANPVHDAWKRLPSQRSGVTYNYLLLLAGLPSVKPDRMILRFLREALGPDADLDNDRAVHLIMSAADVLEVSPRTLDQTIWRSVSGRPITGSDPDASASGATAVPAEYS